MKNYIIKYKFDGFVDETLYKAKNKKILKKYLMDFWSYNTEKDFDEMISIIHLVSKVKVIN